MTVSYLTAFSKLRKTIAPRGFVDAVAGGRIVGWAIGDHGLQVEAWVGEACIARCTPTVRRDDVAVAYPNRRNARTSGFTLDLPEHALTADTIGELRIVAKARQPLWPRTTIGTFRIAGERLARKLADAPDAGTSGPFPRRVIDTIAAHWPEDCTHLNTSAGQRRFVSRLLQVMETPGLNSLPAVADYARYLSATMAHCRFVKRHFPTTNARAKPGAPDFHCQPNSIRELFAIIHQLYVLKSWDVSGDFAEFGCFKGFSSAMLSFACQQLGLRMHIFDSFEGLPPAEGSGYEAGQYAGSLDEVRTHVARFGAVDAVEFHKGFFADTFRAWQPPQLMCLWMDVDLEVSARDLMVVADRLDPRGSLFSHECTAGIFQNGEIVTEPRLDNPVPPILARHVQIHRPLTGRYIDGYTGAFWPRDGGIPVMDNDVLMEMMRGIK